MSEKRFILAAPALLEGAQVTATSEAATMQAANLLRPKPTDYWMAPDLAGLALTVHLAPPAGVPLAWSLVSLPYANFGDGDTWRVEAATTEAGLATPVFDTGLMDGWPQPGLERRPFAHALAWKDRVDGWSASAMGTTRTEPWLRISFQVSNPKLPAGYTGDPFFRAGRLYIADPWQPTFHVDAGFQWGTDERPVSVQTVGGGRRVASRARKERASYTVGFLSRAEALDYGRVLDREVGASGDVIACYDPTDLDRLMDGFIYGTMSLDPLVHEDADIFNRRYTFEEL